jgi:(p)ppGpp synthase/HD superfamily hydrolase
MIYTPLTKLAMITAYDAHNNAPEDKRTDKAGVPYIYHPIHVAEQMNTEDEIEICVALLHDVVEDTQVSFDDLRAKDFPEKIIDSLQLLTKSDSIDYFDYIQSIKNSGDKVAIAVKLADLHHNSDRSRIDNPTPEDEERYAKYEEAIRILLSS